MLLFSTKSLIAGTKWNWSESISDYGADLYTLQIFLKKANGTLKTITTTPDGSSHQISASAAVTALYPFGSYTYHAVVYEIATPGNVISIERGIVEILPDLAIETDPRTFAMKMVDKLQTALLALSDKMMSSISIDGRSYTYANIDQLTNQLTYWESKAGIPGTEKRQRIKFQFIND